MDRLSIIFRTRLFRRFRARGLDDARHQHEDRFNPQRIDPRDSA